MKHIVVSDDIMEKVNSKEKDTTRLDRCLTMGICPECGEGLTCETFNDGGRRYDCIECGLSLII